MSWDAERWLNGYLGVEVVGSEGQLEGWSSGAAASVAGLPLAQSTSGRERARLRMRAVSPDRSCGGGERGSHLPQAPCSGRCERNK